MNTQIQLEDIYIYLKVNVKLRNSSSTKCYNNVHLNNNENITLFNSVTLKEIEIKSLAIQLDILCVKFHTIYLNLIIIIPTQIYPILTMKKNIYRAVCNGRINNQHTLLLFQRVIRIEPNVFHLTTARPNFLN